MHLNLENHVNKNNVTATSQPPAKFKEIVKERNRSFGSLSRSIFRCKHIFSALAFFRILECVSQIVGLTLTQTLAVKWQGTCPPGGHLAYIRDMGFWLSRCFAISLLIQVWLTERVSTLRYKEDHQMGKIYYEHYLRQLSNLNSSLSDSFQS